jgi:ATP-binding cassette subfamily B protein
MLTISVPLALVAMATMPFIYWTGVRMRNNLFPVSWIIQSRLAEVATVVDENVNGVRVVKSFAAEEQQLGSWPARPTRCNGATSRTPTSGPASRR